jgi:hypothetical protein
VGRGNTGATRDGIAGLTHAAFTGNTLTIQNNVASGLHLTTMTGAVTLTNTIITGNGTGLDVNNGTATITLDATNSITANAGQRSVSIQNRPVGANAITLTAPIVDGGLGILVNNNAAGTVAFAGTQTLNTTTNPAATKNRRRPSPPIAARFARTTSRTIPRRARTWIVARRDVTPTGDRSVEGARGFCAP